MVKYWPFVVSVFLDSFPNFKLLSLFVEVTGSAWWLMQHSSQSSLCQNVSERQVAGISINSPALHYTISFTSSLLLRDMGASFCVCTHTHMHTHFLRYSNTVGHQLSVNIDRSDWVWKCTVSQKMVRGFCSCFVAKIPNFTKVFHKFQPPPKKCSYTKQKIILRTHRQLWELDNANLWSYCLFGRKQMCKVHHSQVALFVRSRRILWFRSRFWINETSVPHFLSAYLYLYQNQNQLSLPSTWKELFADSCCLATKT